MATVKFLRSENSRLADALAAETARANEAEADAAHWRELHGDRERDLAHEFTRANAAEADLLAVRLTLADTIDERNDLRAALAACQQSEAYARAEVARLQRLVNQSSRK